jgi:hypothetical protein
MIDSALRSSSWISCGSVAVLAVVLLVPALGLVLVVLAVAVVPAANTKAPAAMTAVVNERIVM